MKSSIREAVRSCDCRQWVKIIKGAVYEKAGTDGPGKKITVMDEKYFHIAEDNLHAELALALGKRQGGYEGFFDIAL